MAIAASAAAGALGLAAPLALNLLVDEIAPAGQTTATVGLAIAVASAGACAAGLEFARGTLLQAVWLAWARTLVVRLLGRLAATSLDTHRSLAPAAVAARLHGAERAREALATGSLSALVASATLCASGAYLVWLDPIVGGTGLATIGLVGVLAATLLRGQANRRSRAAEYEAEAAALLAAGLHARATIWSAGAEEQLHARWRTVHGARLEASLRAQALSDLQIAVDQAAAFLAPAALFAVVAWTGRPSAPGDIVALYAAFGQCLLAAYMLSTAGVSLVRAEEGRRMLGPILALPAGPLAHGRAADLSSAAAITVESLSLAYEPGAAVLTDLTFEIRAGEKVALVGPSGAGKSTLVRLITGVERPSAGKIRVHGIDPTDLAATARRRLIGTALAETPLLGDDVGEEICAGADIPAADVIWAAAAAGVRLDADPTAASDTRTRIGFARALAMRPALVIFDETLKSCDRAEVARLLAAAAEKPGATVLAATHTQFALPEFDRVLFLVDGRIVGFAPFAELSANNEDFRHFAAGEDG